MVHVDATLDLASHARRSGTLICLIVSRCLRVVVCSSCATSWCTDDVERCADSLQVAEESGRRTPTEVMEGRCSCRSPIDPTNQDPGDWSTRVSLYDTIP